MRDIKIQCVERDAKTNNRSVRDRHLETIRQNNKISRAIYIDSKPIFRAFHLYLSYKEKLNVRFKENQVYRTGPADR